VKRKHLTLTEKKASYANSMMAAKLPLRMLKIKDNDLASVLESICLDSESRPVIVQHGVVVAQRSASSGEIERHHDGSSSRSSVLLK
jgi:hypothetical protein